MRYLAFDIGGTAVKHALIDSELQLTHKGSFPTATVSTPQELVEALGALCDGHSSELDGVAVSTAGEVDPATGHMFSGGALRFTAGVNLVDALEARCGLPVSVENDANCALLAEMHDGALVDATNAAVLVIGTGVGGALMLNRRIYHGSHFHSGNASATQTVLRQPFELSTTLGWLNGVGGLTRPLAQRRGVAVTTLDGRAAFDLVDAGDAEALAVLDEYCATLAGFVYNLQVLLDLDVVAIGGGVSARPRLIDTLRTKVDALFDAWIVPLPRPAVRACRHGNDANLIGALLHHLQGSTG